MQPPAIPLRAGPSGPLINLSTYLFNESGILVPRRLWFGEVNAERVIADGYNLSAPYEAATFNVTWGTEELALYAQGLLSYWCIMSAQLVETGSPAAYPSPMWLALGWEPAGAAYVPIRSQSLKPVPLNLGSDFTFRTNGCLQGLQIPNVNCPPFASGTNQIHLDIANPTGSVPVQTDHCFASVVELVAKPAQLFQQLFS